MRVINAGMAQPDNQGRIRQDGMIIAPMDADAFNAFVAHEALRWKPVILKAGLKMEVDGRSRGKREPILTAEQYWPDRDYGFPLSRE